MAKDFTHQFHYIRRNTQKMVPKPIIVTTQPTSATSPPLPTTVRTEEKTKTERQTQTIRTNTSQTKTTRVELKRRTTEAWVPALILNAFDDIINNFIDPPLKPSVDPRRVLTQNFAPVDELPPTPCELLQGTLPPCLDGAYIRNGPNPHFLPRGPYHLFDGDGMLHALRISQGKPTTLCSRYVKTYKYKVENDAGFPLIPNVFSGFNSIPASAARGSLTAARILAGQYNPANGIGLANTSLAFFANRLFALGESDLPYAVTVTPDGDVETVGRCDFDGKLAFSMTAHPKIDPDTGECFAFRCSPVPPFLSYFRFDRNGNKHPDVPIFSVPSPSFLHDFAITKKYAIFCDIQLGMNPSMFLSGGSPVGSIPSKVPRLGILPRDAKDESTIKWFDVPGFNLMHAINAWEEDEGRTVVLVAPNVVSLEHAIERVELVHPVVEKVRIDLEAGIVKRQPLSARNLDFGVLNPAYVGKKNRFVYAAVGDPMPKISGVVKLDVSKGEEVGCRFYGEGCYGGEPFFVAREDAVEEEDDGYLVTYVHDERSGVSKFLVMDAKSPELRVVAAVRLPRRVPYGFHGLFVKESELRKVWVP
ncbi:hypothetical protein Fmac_002739 [Flemingia macrophylla]|uniref:Carotenoid cleavage dioxygenase 4 n=1 Tax=Flemingia macrophylla TaxID=520843 RepID=A0ABD1NKU9_9FABA